MPLEIERGARGWTDRLLGLAVAAMALQEAEAGHLGVHAGLLYGRRAAFLPLLPVFAMIAVWLVQIAAGAALASGWRRRLALSVAAAATFASLTQSFFNQKLFLALTLLALALEAPGLAKSQLLLLYAATFAFKLREGFWTGASLSAALEQVRDREMAPLLVLPLAAAPLAAKLALAAEGAVPLLLWKKPCWGVAAAFALHLGFSACLPGLWPFTLTAWAAALLFLPPRSARGSAR